MRDYMIHEAQSRLAFGRMSGLVRVVSNWRMRKTLKQMRDLSVYHLRDIGLNTGELERLIALPLSHDHQWAQDRKTNASAVNPSSLALLLARGAALFLRKPRHQKIQRGTLAA